VCPVAIQTLTPLGIGIIAGSEHRGPLRTPALPCAPHHLHGAGIRKPSQSRRFGDVRVTSVFPLITDVRQRGRQSEKVRITEIITKMLRSSTGTFRRLQD
jgi:hypothetical protein